MGTWNRGERPSAFNKRCHCHNRCQHRRSGPERRREWHRDRRRLHGGIPGIGGKASTGGSGGGAPAPGCGNTTAPKSAQNLTIQVAGKARTYLLFVPNGFDAAKSIPLIVAWHSSGASVRSNGSTITGVCHGWSVGLYMKTPRNKLCTTYRDPFANRDSPVQQPPEDLIERCRHGSVAASDGSPGGGCWTEAETAWIVSLQ